MNSASVVQNTNNSASGSKPTTTKVGTKRKQASNNYVVNKAARFNTSIASGDDGKTKKVVLIPTDNGFDGLQDDDEGDEVIINSPMR